MITDVLINGAPSDGRIPVTDSTVLRGDGCFEVLRAYDGRAFGMKEHLDRLARSAAALQIELPNRDDLVTWVEKTAAALGNGAVRVVVSRGSAIPGHDQPSNVIVFGHTWTTTSRPHVSRQSSLPGMQPVSTGSSPAPNSRHTPRT